MHTSTKGLCISYEIGGINVKCVPVLHQKCIKDEGNASSCSEFDVKFS